MDIKRCLPSNNEHTFLNEYLFVAPIYGVVKDSPITLNWYRNEHFRVSNKAKKKFKLMMREQILSFDSLTTSTKVKVHYDYYAKRRGTDLDNFVSIVKKFFQDAIVELGFLNEDHTEIIISNSEDYCGIDKENPRIEIKITCVT